MEIGIEILNPIQVTAENMDPETFKTKYGKDLIFFGAIDYNEILNHGSEETVRAGSAHDRYPGIRWKIHRCPIP
jgi:uroporphyrinogen decarboxylase